MHITKYNQRSFIGVLKTFLIDISNVSFNFSFAIIFDEPEIPESLLLEEYSKSNN